MKSKKILYYIISFLAVLSFSCSEENSKPNEGQTPVSYESLPGRAQDLIEDYFGGKENIDRIEKETIESVVVFEVYFKDGYEIIFNEEGYWQEIDAPEGQTIPTALIPQPIMQTLNSNFYGYGVVVINTQNENYHLVLSNNQGGESIELLMNQSGDILQQGSM